MTKLEEEAFELFQVDNPNWVEQYPQWRHVPVNERNRYIQEAKTIAIADRSTQKMGANEGKVEDTINEREKVYGPYKGVCQTRSYIMNILKQHHMNVNGTDMDKVTEVAFGDLVLKLVRGAGAPEYADSFHDLGGYSKRMEELANEKPHI